MEEKDLPTKEEELLNAAMEIGLRAIGREEEESLPDQDSIIARRLADLEFKAQIEEETEAERIENEKKEAKRFEDSHTLWMAANGRGLQAKVREGKVMKGELALAINKVIAMVPIIEPGDKNARDKWQLLKKLEMLRDQMDILMVPEMIAAGWYDALNLIQTYCYGDEEWQKAIRKYWETGSIDEVFLKEENKEKEVEKI